MNTPLRCIAELAQSLAQASRILTRVLEGHSLSGERDFAARNASRCMKK